MTMSNTAESQIPSIICSYCKCNAKEFSTKNYSENKFKTPKIISERQGQCSSLKTSQRRCSQTQFEFEFEFESTGFPQNPDEHCTLIGEFIETSEEISTFEQRFRDRKTCESVGLNICKVYET